MRLFAIALGATLAAGAAHAACPYDPGCPVFDFDPGIRFAPRPHYSPLPLSTPGLPRWHHGVGDMARPTPSSPYEMARHPVRTERLRRADPAGRDLVEPFAGSNVVDRFPGRDLDRDGVSPDDEPGTGLLAGRAGADYDRGAGARRQGMTGTQPPPNLPQQPAGAPQQAADQPQQPMNGFYTGPDSGAGR